MKELLKELDAQTPRVCEIASIHLIRELEKVNVSSTGKKKRAAQIAQLALLALRDSENRPDNPEILEARLEQIQSILEHPTNAFSTSTLTPPKPSHGPVRSFNP